MNEMELILLEALVMAPIMILFIVISVKEGKEMLRKFNNKNDKEK